VLQADSAMAALRELDARPEITLLFTDIVMPEMNGRRLADEALARRPDLKVLFTTGFTRNAVIHNGTLDAGVQFLTKPFTLEVLSAKLQDVLTGPPARGPEPATPARPSH
jgi:CheY-like chemotaxis protein